MTLESLLSISPADLVFGLCLLVGGALLLLTLIFDDLFGGIFGALHLGFDVTGASPTPILLGFVAMFGLGGLFGLHSLVLSVTWSTIIALASGSLGGLVVLGAFRVLNNAASSTTFSLSDMVGTTAYVSVGIPASHYGTVLISFAGSSHSLGATADTDIPVGHRVKVTGVAGTNLVVAPL
jgi:membrane protein implicated in regulation of membrane protease activity